MQTILDEGLVRDSRNRERGVILCRDIVSLTGLGRLALEDSLGLCFMSLLGEGSIFLDPAKEILAAF